MSADEYRVYRLINGDEMEEYTSGDEFKRAVGDLVMSQSRPTFHVREEDSETLIVECL